MATILTPDSDLLDLLTAPFNATTDFTRSCRLLRPLRRTLIETNDPALQLALCRSSRGSCAIATHTTQPHPATYYRKPLPLIPSATPEHFISEPDSLCEYCLALLQLLLERPAEPKMEQTLTGLLCELVWYFTEGLENPALAAYRRRRKIYQ